LPIAHPSCYPESTATGVTPPHTRTEHNTTSTGPLPPLLLSIESLAVYASLQQGPSCELSSAPTITNTILGTRKETVSWMLWKDNRTRTRRLGGMAIDSDARLQAGAASASARTGVSSHWPKQIPTPYAIEVASTVGACIATFIYHPAPSHDGAAQTARYVGTFKYLAEDKRTENDLVKGQKAVWCQCTNIGALLQRLWFYGLKLAQSSCRRNIYQARYIKTLSYNAKHSGAHSYS
ncbi:hypothetical protein GGF50DRAFT_93261, partial [Schizophyllum commune]